jgi:hypothetical protein
MLRIAPDRQSSSSAACRTRESTRVSARASNLMLLLAVALAGCAPAPAQHVAPVAIRAAAPVPAVREPIPLPDPALLAFQDEPRCEFTGSDVEDDGRIRLDYERQCYRHAEMIARDRLRALQEAVNDTVGAVRRSERAR